MIIVGRTLGGGRVRAHRRCPRRRTRHDRRLLLLASRPDCCSRAQLCCAECSSRCAAARRSACQRSALRSASVWPCSKRVRRPSLRLIPQAAASAAPQPSRSPVARAAGVSRRQHTSASRRAAGAPPRHRPLAAIRYEAPVQPGHRLDPRPARPVQPQLHAFARTCAPTHVGHRGAGTSSARRMLAAAAAGEGRSRTRPGEDAPARGSSSAACCRHTRGRRFARLRGPRAAGASLLSKCFGGRSSAIHHMPTQPAPAAVAAVADLPVRRVSRCCYRKRPRLGPATSPPGLGGGAVTFHAAASHAPCARLRAAAPSPQQQQRRQSHTYRRLSSLAWRSQSQEEGVARLLCTVAARCSRRLRCCAHRRRPLLLLRTQTSAPACPTRS